METQLIQNSINFKHVLVTDLELKGGIKTQMMTIFNNNDICFEEVNIGVQKALEHALNVETMQSTFGSITSGKFKPVCFFEKTAIEPYNVELDYNLKLQVS